MWLAGLGLGAVAVGGLVYLLASKKDKEKSGGSSATDRVPPSGVDIWAPVTTPFVLEKGQTYRVSFPDVSTSGPPSPEELAFANVLETVPERYATVYTQAPSDWPKDDLAGARKRIQMSLPNDAVSVSVPLAPASFRFWRKS